MKKSLSVVLAIIIAHISLVALVAFDGKLTGLVTGKEYKFGASVSASYGEIKNATSEADGSGEAVVDVAAVLVDRNGKIVKCVLDCASSKAVWTDKGKAVDTGEFKTKYELKDDYNMVAYGGAVQEWYQQADAFAKLCEGKTIDEVKALMVDGYKPNDEVVKAGCTIAISGFVSSIEKAVENATWSYADKDSSLKLGIQTSATPKDVSEEGSGETKISTTVVAAVLDESGKIEVASTDVADVSFYFNASGESVTDTSAEIKTKKAAGENYGMAAYGQDLNGDGKVLEWNEQGAAFDAALVGKDAAGVAALATDIGYGSDDLQTAGCTIHVGDMVKAASKIVK